MIVAILIVYMLWSFLCSRFDKNARVTDRNVKLWELLHFPLSFGLLLLLGAIVVSRPCLCRTEIDPVERGPGNSKWYRNGTRPRGLDRRR
jgi:hypothetical protein